MSAIRWLSVLAALALTYASAEDVPQYGGYRLLRVVPETTEQLETLVVLQEESEIDFWREPRGLGLPVDLFVGPEHVFQVTQILLDAGLQYEVVMDDPQSLIDSQIEEFSTPKAFGWDDYQTLDAIHGWLKEQAQKNNKIATIITAGQSVEGRPLLGLRIAHKTNLPIVFLEAGIHAREWISPATATWIIQQALNGTNDLIKSYEWHVFPSVNPDGYAFTQKSRLWRKSRRNLGSCIGVDLNRNWPYQWKKSGSTCSETYPGSDAGSEPETQGLATYLKSVLSRTRVYISLHSYSQLLMYPWGYGSTPPPNNQRLNDIAGKATQALKKRYGTPYRYGPIATTIYAAPGNTVDYAYSLNITYPYVFELRDTGVYGFLLPKNQIIPTALETFDAVSVILQEAKN